MESWTKSAFSDEVDEGPCYSPIVLKADETAQPKTCETPALLVLVDCGFTRSLRKAKAVSSTRASGKALEGSVCVSAGSV